MTAIEFKRLPLLLKRGQVVEALGVQDRDLDTMRVWLHSPTQTVPLGKIGAVRGMARARGRKGKGYWHYRKCDLFPLVPKEWRE